MGDRGCEYSSRSKMAPNSIVVVPPEHSQISRQIPAVDSLEIVAAECCEQMGAEFHHVQSATPDVLEMNEAQYEPKARARSQEKGTASKRAELLAENPILP